MESWTEKEENLIIANYRGFERNKISEVKLAENLERPVKDIRKKAYELGLATPPQRKKDFTEEEIDFLKTNFQEMSLSELAKNLNSTIAIVRSFSERIGLKKTEVQREWTAQEVMFLKNNSSLTYAELMDCLPGKSKKNIITKLKDLGWEKQGHDVWAEVQIEFVVANYPKLNVEEISKVVRKTRKAVVKKLTEFGIQAIDDSDLWKPAEVTFLKENYDKLLMSELKNWLKRRSHNEILVKRNELGLLPNAEYLEKREIQIWDFVKQHESLSHISKELGIPIQILREFCIAKKIPFKISSYDKVASKEQAERYGFFETVEIALPGMTLCQWFSYWFSNFKETSITEKTKERYYRIYVSLYEHGLGQKPIRGVMRADVQQYIKTFGENHSKATVTGYLQYIRSAMRDAMNEGVISRNPAENVSLVFKEQRLSVLEKKKKREEKKWLEIDEYQKVKYSLFFTLQKILAEKPRYSHEGKPSLYVEQQYLTIILVALKTGARFAEILGITEDSIDFDTGVIYIDKSWDYVGSAGFKPTKNISSIREIIVDQETINILKQYISWKNNFKLRMNQNTIFVLESSPINNSTVNTQLRKLLTKLGIAPITFHKLRHTHASYLLSKGVPIAVVAKRLGHNDTTMIQKVYGHLLKETEDSANKLILDLI